MATMHERLRSALKRRGWRQKELAERATVSPPYLSLILSGKRRPNTDVLLRIVDALGLDPIDDVFGMQEAGAVWADQPTNGARDALSAAYRRARHPETFEIAASAQGFGLLAGDLVVIDIGARATSGHLVLVQITLDEGRQSLTVRRLAGDLLVPDGIAGDIDEANPADGSVAVRGPIIAVVRQIEA